MGEATTGTGHADEPDPTISLLKINSRQLRDGDLVISAEQLASRSRADADGLIKKVGEMGYLLARLTRPPAKSPETGAEELLPYDHETHPPLGTRRIEELQDFLGTSGVSVAVSTKAYKLLFSMNHVTLNPDEADGPALEYSERGPLLVWEESRAAYSSEFWPYPGHAPILINIDELEWHMRNTDFYRSYRGVGTKTVSAVNSFVNAAVIEAPKTEVD